MVFKNQFVKNERGQTTVEYILLLAVVMIAVTTVFKSDLFKKIFGENGKFSTTFRAEMEFSYRHGIRGRELYRKPNYKSPQHKSYIWRGTTTRFFGAKDVYPK